DPYVDADFGIAYTSEKLTVQAVLPKLRNILSNTGNTIYNTVTFYGAVSYKHKIDHISIEPKIAYRKVKDYDNIIDAGINAAFSDDKFNILALYHTTHHAVLGFGYLFQKQVQLQAAYTVP